MAVRRMNLPGLAGRLEERYPGVQCLVEWLEYAPEPRCDIKGHALWDLSLLADDRATLIGHGLASLAQFEARAATGRVLSTANPGRLGAAAICRGTWTPVTARG
jgi:hypothetical protein